MRVRDHTGILINERSKAHDEPPLIIYEKPDTNWSRARTIISSKTNKRKTHGQEGEKEKNKLCYRNWKWNEYIRRYLKGSSASVLGVQFFFARSIRTRVQKNTPPHMKHYPTMRPMEPCPKHIYALIFISRFFSLPPERDGKPVGEFYLR